MPITRRRLLLSSSLTPILTSCATDLRSYKALAISEVAAKRHVCSATYATLSSGSVKKLEAISGCTPGQPPHKDTVFQAASLTKPVVAYAFLKLASSERIDLNAPVSKFLPAGYKHFHNVLARGENDPRDLVARSTLSRIPLYTLLNHSSGLPNWSGQPLSLSFTPAERWQYSGEGYMMLQSVIEAVSGHGFVRFMDEQVFTHLEMRHSSLVWKEEYVANEQSSATALWPSRSARFTYPVAAASLHTTAGDYAKFLSAVVADPRLISQAISAPVSVAPSLGIEWGLGWGIERSAGGPNLWHWGNNPGFRSFTMVSVTTGDGFVIFTSSNNGMALAVPLAYEVLPMEHNAFQFSMVG